MSYQAVIRLLGAIPTQGRYSTASIVDRVNLSGKPLEKRSVERGLASVERGLVLARARVGSCAGAGWSLRGRGLALARARVGSCGRGLASVSRPSVNRLEAALDGVAGPALA